MTVKVAGGHMKAGVQNDRMGWGLKGSGKVRLLLVKAQALAQEVAAIRPPFLKLPFHLLLIAVNQPRPMPDSNMSDLNTLH